MDGTAEWAAVLERFAIMTLALTGLSHHASPLALRERMAVGTDAMECALAELHARLRAAAPADDEAGAVLLSTCNRVEVYLRAALPAEALHALARGFLAAWNRLEEPEFRDFLYERDNADAVRHLFRVSASLDSLVVGETEILGQVQQAYDAALQRGAADKIIGVLFQRALKTGKDVRTRTRIGEGRISVASVAVDLAETVLKSLEDKTVMILGSGPVSEQALKSVVSKGAARVIVLNRTLERAVALAEKYRGEAAALPDVMEHLHRADIVIGSTGAQASLLGEAEFRAAMERRGRAPMLVIDIAVPRDIDRKAGEVENVYYYDIDDLQQTAERNLRMRQAEMEQCEAIVEESVGRFMAWRRSLHAEPTILWLAQEFHAVRERELARALDKLNGLTEAQRAEVERLSQRIVNAILQRPITRLKEEMSTDDPEAALMLVRRIFGFGEEEL
ncbi:MAG: glutamyl-tRNA reductase [Candidatus Hydrogenedens sp.]|nr:glutamyl-tRNA reductase [Candidatus Hydrogenedens sp.]